MKDFYALALPNSGIYCVTDIDPITKKTKNIFVESIDELVEVAQSKKKIQIFLLHLVILKGIAERRNTLLVYVLSL